MDTLAPDIAKKLLSRDLANLAQRIQRGEKLSKAERVMLQNMAARAGETPAVAGDFSELARILQISRRTMNRWRKHPDAPPPGPIFARLAQMGGDLCRSIGLKRATQHNHLCNLAYNMDRYACLAR
jgi:hypothetical protein